MHQNTKIANLFYMIIMIVKLIVNALNNQVVVQKLKKCHQGPINFDYMIQKIV